MHPLQAALNIARNLFDAAPRYDVDELALAMHKVANEGRPARFGSAACRHREAAEKVIEFIENGRSAA